jgi:signal peptidase I
VRWAGVVAAGALAVGLGALAGVARGRLRAVAVSGPSMVPALRDGDAVLAWSGGRVRPTDVVIARFPARPELLVVKRAVRPVPGGWWVQGDNAFATDDSRRYGPAEVVARVLVRYWPVGVSRWRAARNSARLDALRVTPAVRRARSAPPRR